VNYFDHNDRKNADARIRAQIHNAERAKAKDFDGTLVMAKWEVIQSRKAAMRVLTGDYFATAPDAREPRCEFSANRAMAGGR
jgi:hypothetical protein